MLLLNRHKVYILYLCVFISIHLMLLLNIIQSIRSGSLFHFNTSYVVIKLRLPLPLPKPRKYFNTSYVVIKLVQFSNLTVQFHNFNTSYVVIKRLWQSAGWSKCIISIHLMLLLNKFSFAMFLAVFGFQYILCCY